MVLKAAKSIKPKTTDLKFLYKISVAPKKLSVEKYKDINFQLKQLKEKYD